MNEGSPPMQQRPSSIPLSLQRETEFQKKLPLESNKLIKVCKRGREGERWRYDPLGGLAGLSLTRALWLKEKNYFNPHFSHLARTPLTCLGAEMRPLHQKSVRQVTLAKSSKNWGDAHKGPSSGLLRGRRENLSSLFCSRHLRSKLLGSSQNTPHSINTVHP